MRANEIAGVRRSSAADEKPSAEGARTSGAAVGQSNAAGRRAYKFFQAGLKNPNIAQRPSTEFNLELKPMNARSINRYGLNLPTGCSLI